MTNLHTRLQILSDRLSDPASKRPEYGPSMLSMVREELKDILKDTSQEPNAREALADRRIGDIIYLVDNSGPVDGDWEAFAKAQGKLLKSLAEEARAALRQPGAPRGGSGSTRQSLSEMRGLTNIPNSGRNLLGRQCKFLAFGHGDCGEGTMKLEPLEERGMEQVALWIMGRGYATGHGDTIESMLEELILQVARRAETDGYNKGVRDMAQGCPICREATLPLPIDPSATRGEEIT